MIDEGQDLVGEDWLKYNGTQAFYYMAYKALKPIDNSKPKLKRLIWAYDELQKLNSIKVPSNKEIFGDYPEIRELTSGVYYEGGIKKSEIMKVCYRTPHLILTTAHATGMGLFRPEGMVCGYTTEKAWEDIGHKSIRTRIAKAMNRAGLNYYVPQAPRNNVTEFHWRDKEGDKFWSDDAGTIASVYEAKGNEANMVYVLGVENVAQREGKVNVRNELFVALTRARCWVKVMGLGEYRFYEEFRKAIEAGGKFEFVKM